MKIISWMLTRLVLTRFLAIAFGVSAFVVSLEVVSYSKEIIALRPDDYSIFLQYMVTRLPVTLATFLPISVLLAMLLTLTELSYRNEIAALWSSGLSPTRFIVMLLPLALLLGAFHFFLGDYVIPKVSPQLRLWAIGDYGNKKMKSGDDDPIWMRAGTDILRVEKASPDSLHLTNVIVFRRNPAGILTEQIYAAEANSENGRWLLKNVDVYYGDSLPTSHLETLVYSGAMTPAAAGNRAGVPEEMSMQDLRYFVENDGFGIKPVWVYRTWWFKRLAAFLSGLVMFAICIPLSSRFRRGGGLGSLFAAGVAMGFVYFVVDGISVTMGELGFVKPWLAAWFPTVGFLSFATFMTLNAERV